MNATIVIVALLAVSGEMDEQVVQDFRDGGHLHPAFSLFGPDAGQTVTLEPEGLRITFPKERENAAAVGISPRFQLAGDFEITVDYEILEAEPPPKGLGAGVKLWAQIDTESVEAATLAHLVRPQRGTARVAILAQEGKQQFAQRATDQKSGRLRLARKGTQLSFQVAEGASDMFGDIRCVQVGAGDVTSVRISANTHDVAWPLSVRLVSLDIRADRMPGKPKLARRRSGWLVVAIGVVVLAAAGAGGFALWRRPWRGKGGQ